MDYYDSKDIVKITGLCKSSSYKLIDKLNEKLKKEYPGTITINARIPKWYFEKKVLLKEPERSDKMSIKKEERVVKVLHN